MLLTCMHVNMHAVNMHAANMHVARHWRFALLLTRRCPLQAHLIEDTPDESGGSGSKFGLRQFLDFQGQEVRDYLNAAGHVVEDGVYT